MCHMCFYEPVDTNLDHEHAGGDTEHMPVPQPSDGAPYTFDIGSMFVAVDVGPAEVVPPTDSKEEEIRSEAAEVTNRETTNSPTNLSLIHI